RILDAQEARWLGDWYKRQAKMKLEVGDIILECNGIKVATGDELYEALQKSPAYCRLKVKNFEGELKLAESAIYADSPHEIGLVLFE
ncbi:MAG: hypothetical protein K2O72_03560, partial [Ligilactobacillus sp.]|nr:hypothetical protein [Ligilactobacillus sp.]